MVLTGRPEVPYYTKIAYGRLLTILLQLLGVNVKSYLHPFSYESHNICCRPIYTTMLNGMVEVMVVGVVVLSGGSTYTVIIDLNKNFEIKILKSTYMAN